MAIFDVNNPPSEPDSSLDSDITLEKNIIIAGSAIQPIAPGDWVDGTEGITPPDPLWGLSYQVMTVSRTEDPPSQQVNVMYWNPSEENYYIDGMDTSLIQGCFRRVMQVEL